MWEGNPILISFLGVKGLYEMSGSDVRPAAMSDTHLFKSHSACVNLKMKGEDKLKGAVERDKNRYKVCSS